MFISVLHSFNKEIIQLQWDFLRNLLNYVLKPRKFNWNELQDTISFPLTFFNFLYQSGMFMLQYQKCDPSDPMCAMMECGHSMTSLKERAMDKKCDEIVKLIEQVSLGKVNTHWNSISILPHKKSGNMNDLINYRIDKQIFN